MGFAVQDPISGQTAKVNTAREQVVALGREKDTAGYALNMSENDAGAITGTRTIRSPETSQDYRTRVGMDSPLFRDTFNATTQNTSLWAYAFATMTASQPGAGTLNFGTVQGTANGHGAFMRTFRQFPLFGTFPLAVEITAAPFTASLVANELFAAGLGLPAGAAALPNDGVFLRLTSAGLVGILRYNGVETATDVLRTGVQIELDNLAKYVIVVGERVCEFWLDDNLLGTLDVPAAQGQPMQAAAVPVFLQKFCTGSVTNTNTMRVSDVTVSLMDMQAGRDYPTMLSGAGNSSMQAQNGATQGSTATWANNANPTTAAPSNTALTANLPNGLSGQGVATLWNLAATDMILQQYQNPLGGVNQSPRTLYITAVRLSIAAFGVAWTAPAAGQHLFMFGLGVGGTATSLAQAETASFATGTAKAHRRKALGLIGVATGAAPVGTPGDRMLQVDFATPLVVNPGEFLTIIGKMLNGAATASGQLFFTYDFDGYFE